MKLNAFIPRSRSKLVFILVMACYTWTTASVLSSLVRVFHLPPPPPGLFTSHGQPVMRVSDLLLLAPLIESLILVGAIELCRWLSAPAWLQVLAAALLVALLHCFPWKPHGLIVAPSFAIQAGSYLYWRAASRKVAFGVVACIHILHNSIPAISVIAYATRNV